jgi:hypothetical protein
MNDQSTRCPEESERERNAETPLNNALSETLPTAMIEAIIFNAFIVSVTDNTPNPVFVFGVAYFATLSVLGLHNLQQ